jgi:magnesium and cobalt transporter
MSHEPASNKHKPWLERLSEVFLREPHDRRELIDLLYDAKERQIIENDALKMIVGVLQVSEMKVRDAMIPRSQMVTVPEHFTVQEAITHIIDTAHSRYPVISEQGDKVIGILLAKDLLRYVLTEHANDIKIKQLIRTAVFIPDSKRLNLLLRDFRITRNHIAIVVDEYGATSGLITIEDVLEEIVGEIEDEYDITEEPNILEVADNQYRVNSLTSVEEFNEYFNTHFNIEEVDTIGGLLLQKLSHLPSEGELIELDDLIFHVTQASNRGIQVLTVSRQKNEDQDNEPKNE